MGANLTLEISDDPTAEDSAVIDRELTAFNWEASAYDEVRMLASFARVPSGELVAGAVGRTWGEVAELQQVWVHRDHRRSGIGARLVRTFEERARARACNLVYLTTFSFHAPEFYRKLGYVIACEIPGYPRDVSKFILKRTLEGA